MGPAAARAGVRGGVHPARRTGASATTPTSCAGGPIETRRAAATTSSRWRRRPSWVTCSGDVGAAPAEVFDAAYYRRFYRERPVHDRRTIGRLRQRASTETCCVMVGTCLDPSAVLDVGAGTGSVAGLVRRRVRRTTSRYRSIDVSDYACRRYGHEQRGHLALAPADDAVPDLVVCQGVLAVPRRRGRCSRVADRQPRRPAYAATAAVPGGADGRRDRDEVIDPDATDLDIHWRTGGLVPPHALGRPLPCDRRRAVRRHAPRPALLRARDGRARRLRRRRRGGARQKTRYGRSEPPARARSASTRRTGRGSPSSGSTSSTSAVTAPSGPSTSITSPSWIVGRSAESARHPVTSRRWSHIQTSCDAPSCSRCDATRSTPPTGAQRFTARREARPTRPGAPMRRHTSANASVGPGPLPVVDRADGHVALDGGDAAEQQGQVHAGRRGSWPAWRRRAARARPTGRRAAGCPRGGRSGRARRRRSWRPSPAGRGSRRRSRRRGRGSRGCDAGADAELGGDAGLVEQLVLAPVELHHRAAARTGRGPCRACR